MAHDVFISYSSRDKVIADAVCASLEAAKVRCWIAPRDVIPGDDWSAALIEAIAASRVMILIFSSHSNASSQVRREVERAVHHEVYLIPFRIEDAPPSTSLQYFVSTSHWLDAFTPPLEKHIRSLVQMSKAILDALNEGAGVESLRIGGDGREVGRDAAPATAPSHSMLGRLLLPLFGILVLLGAWRLGPQLLASGPTTERRDRPNSLPEDSRIRGLVHVGSQTFAERTISSFVVGEAIFNRLNLRDYIRSEPVLGDFVFEVVCDIGIDHSFVGFGDGVPDPAGFGEPAHGVYVRLNPDGFFDSHLRLMIRDGNHEITLPLAEQRSGTYKVRLTRRGVSLQFQVGRYVQGRPFLAESFTSIDLRKDAAFLQDFEPRVFFGATNPGNRFRELSWVDLPTPASSK